MGWPGSAHDSRVFRRSEVKRVWERQQEFKMVADTAYPISDVVIKPYLAEEALNDRRKRLFNRRLSGMRTQMTECIYGMWKRRFPILRDLRYFVELSQKVILATAILENMAR